MVCCCHAIVPPQHHEGVEIQMPDVGQCRLTSESVANVEDLLTTKVHADRRHCDKDFAWDGDDVSLELSHRK